MSNKCKCMGAIYTEEIMKKTLIVEFMDEYLASLADFTPWIRDENGETTHIKAIGNLKSPYIWYVTMTTAEKVKEFMKNLPPTIKGFDVLVYRPWEKIDSAKILWVPHWILSTDVKNAIQNYVSTFHLSRSKRTEKGFHGVFNTSYNLYSPEDLTTIPENLPIKCINQAHLVYARVNLQVRLDWDQISPSHQIPCKFEQNDVKSNSNEVAESDMNEVYL